MPKIKSKFASFGALFCLLGLGNAFAAWDGTSSAEPATETVGGKTYYLIANEANLKWFADRTAPTANNANPNSNINAKLTANLDMGHKLFTPIAPGLGDTKFNGIFDGDGHSISNLYIDGVVMSNLADNLLCNAKGKPGCNGQNVGFVGVLGTGTIKNLVLADVDIRAAGSGGEFVQTTGGQVSVGAVVGWLGGTGTVTGCYTTGVIHTSGKAQGVGGVVGNAGYGTITNCISKVNIEANGDEVMVGGVVGYVKNNGVRISSCVYAGERLVNTGENGSTGGVAGKVVNTVTASDLYYDASVAGRGVGSGNGNNGTTGVPELSNPEIVCTLNGGTLTDGVCSEEGLWSVAPNGEIACNGVSTDVAGDVVYTIEFDANGGSFPAGAIRAKALHEGERVTVDGITLPVRGDTVLAGWALDPGAAAPAANLGTVDRARTVYAVWSTMREITFSAAPGTFPDGATSKTKLVADGAAVGTAGIALPTSWTDGEGVV
ncbi:MAG: hypothetical protein J6Y56_02115, partial [Fibrobacterales bacterium]|nr:hypothetical protein [Fibrobacterales bacterium]